MNKLNVFNNPYYKWRYPSCWFKNIRMFIHSIKYAYQRITKGYADCDTFDLDSYYLDIFNGTLNYLADHHWGYPGHDEFDTDEKWTAYLKEMAQKFYQANESNEYYDTPNQEKWWEWIEENNSNSKDNSYIKDMLNEERFLAWRREQDMREGLDMMKNVFFSLWD